MSGIRKLRAELKCLLPPGAGHEADLILEHVLEIPRARLNLEPAEPTPELARQAIELARRRAAAEPLQYLLGWVPFLDARIQVGPGALIPRPETEYLAETALRLWRKLGAPSPQIALDVGTGSGCIAVAAALAEPRLRWIGLDSSAEALEWAVRNVGAHSLEHRVDLYNSDLFQALEAIEFSPRGASLVVSNPPYIADGQRDSLPPDVVDHEPHPALFAGTTGLEILERIVFEAPRWLSSPGLLALEIGETQMDNVLSLVESSGRYQAWEGRLDLAGRPRMVFART